MALVLTDSLQTEIDRILKAPNAFEVLKLTVTSFTKEKANEQFTLLMEPFARATRDMNAMRVREKLKLAKSTLLDDVLRSKEASKVQEKVSIAWNERQELEAIEQRTRQMESRAANILAAMEAAAAFNATSTPTATSSSLP
ncbi:Hypothetical protein, putative [Bodo saltans]|uniref:Uncharacterized protein n=1 Tax=Bodo saltans TaxID=75058 RepID=A0A0S4J3L8_BODSA|nr:Hypothetical protein, putative [Bodo saltans]|eukprot:CUG86010.1 Hypothetical protein, putative [Bodo saltans]